jgi:hypothetical protein
MILGRSARRVSRISMNGIDRCRRKGEQTALGDGRDCRQGGRDNRLRLVGAKNPHGGSRATARRDASAWAFLRLLSPHWRQPLLKAVARYERTLEAVGCSTLCVSGHVTQTFRRVSSCRRRTPSTPIRMPQDRLHREYSSRPAQYDQNSVAILRHMNTSRYSSEPYAHRQAPVEDLIPSS